MVVVLLIAIVIAIYLALKMIQWKLYYLAILLYYAETGKELPDKATQLKYCEKVMIKTLGIKVD